ncbi:MAG: hypothetical protein HQ564_00790 [Candidatus Saganbacteria bacterium]|nr:hypothetical protein [Candidatus Saganbacteria bacterium]
MILKLLVIFILFISPGFANDWGFDGGNVGWQASAGVVLKQSDGVLNIKTTGESSYVVSPQYEYIDTDNYSVVEIRMKLNRAYQESRLFFLPFGFENFDRGLSLSFATAGMNKFRRYFIDMKNHPYWQGSVRHLLLTLPSNCEVEIDYIKLHPPGFWYSLRSAWQEFLFFRMPNLGTCFIISPITINFKPVNQYIYLMAIALFLVSISYFLISQKGGFQKALFVTVVFIFAIWFVLSLRSLYDDYRVLHNDFSRFYGKSLDEKHIAETGRDYYQFLKWTREKLGGRKEITLHVPGIVRWAPTDFLKMKGPYYLVPNATREDAKYHIVYDDKRPEGKFKLFAEFRPGAYILERTE